MSPYARKTPPFATAALEGLDGALELYRARTDQLARDFADAVCACIEAGATWGEVGKRLGMSKQAARAHWGPYLAENLDIRAIRRPERPPLEDGT
jgi:cytochrome c-type biogenesis protein CcmH/NrfG